MEKKYSEEEIKKLLSCGYINVHKQLWEYIPNGAHIRYFRKGNEPRNERFRPGGFVHCQFTSDGKKMLKIGTSPPWRNQEGNAGNANSIKFNIAYDEISEIWKKYERNAFIELHLFHTVFLQKKAHIENLESRVKKLESIVKDISRRK